MLCIVEIFWGKEPVTSEGKIRVTGSMNDQLIKGDHKLKVSQRWVRVPLGGRLGPQTKSGFDSPPPTPPRRTYSGADRPRGQELNTLMMCATYRRLGGIHSACLSVLSGLHAEQFPLNPPIEPQGRSGVSDISVLYRFAAGANRQVISV